MGGSRCDGYPGRRWGTQRFAAERVRDRSMSPVRLLAPLLVVVITLAGCSSATTGSLPSLSSPVRFPPTTAASAALAGPISSPGGPYLYDDQGRVVFFHGVKAVYKLPPYELYPDRGKAWNFTAADASLMARLGFNVVRLGMTWKGLEPDSARANDPAICTKGPPHDPGQFNQAVLNRYLNKLNETVTLLGRFHIYTLLDMHQDVYNEIFDGEGAPNWAVCTNGLPNTDPPGRWSRNYATAAAGAAYANFWSQRRGRRSPRRVRSRPGRLAGFFRGNPWVLGYDPFNEPFSTSLVTSGDEQFDAQLECFYTGTALLGAPAPGAPAISCPPDDAAVGVIPQMLSADPAHLIFYEPDIFGSRGYPNFVGPMNFPSLVLNVHIYCSQRSGKTGNPTNVGACAAQEERSLTRRSEDRAELSSPAQPQGPAWFVSEFGATSNVALLDRLTSEADRSLVGWTYWSWKYYGDPTGSAAEALVASDGQLRSTARVLAATYPEATAGRPTSLSFDPSSGAFHYAYVPNHSVHAPTVIFVPTQIHYPDGYCARVSGATVVSRSGSQFLEVDNRRSGDTVTVTVTAGACPHR